VSYVLNLLLSSYLWRLAFERSGDWMPVGTRFSACPDRPWGPPCIL